MGEILLLAVLFLIAGVVAVPIALIVLGTAAFRAGKPEQAAAACRDVLSSDPGAATALELLGAHGGRIRAGAPAIPRARAPFS